MASKKRQAIRLINLVAVALLLLTILEAWLATITGSAAILFLIALAKGGAVMYYFMHIYRLWRSPEEGH